MNELNKQAEGFLREIRDIKIHLNLPQKEQKLLEIQDRMQAKDFWADTLKAKQVAQEYDQLAKFVAFWRNLEKQTQEFLQLLGANRDDSAETKKFLSDQFEVLEKQYRQNRFLALLDKKYDDHNAIFSVHSGAGGADAQDWADMLLRMFLRYCDRKNFEAEILELNRGEQGGLKTAVVEVRGPYAYGLLKSEAGVHRLVRLSPFNPAHTRETSFALMELLPLLETEEEIKLNPKDLKLETSTSSGHGGQSVNTTYSAVRITHIPTGLKVSIQNERSQRQNRELAIKILQAKLKTLEEEKQQKEKQAIRGEFKSAEWGNQIRSYVLHPYKLVKDHRTGFETHNPEGVLNGELEELVETYLEKTAKT